MITERDIYLATCGINERGISKALVKVETAIVMNQNSTPDTVDSIILDNPVINMIKTRAFTMIDLTFPSGEDYEFINLSTMLSDFCSVENTMNEDNGEMPAICVSICPKEYNGEYVVVGMHAMWTLHQSRKEKGIDTIRFIVENGFMHTYQLNVDGFNLEKAEEEADKEIKEGNYQ